MRGRLLIVLVLLAGCAQGPSVGRPPSELVIAAGEASGVYYQYGQGLAQALSEDLPSTTVSTRVTSGSVDNVEMLSRGEAALAFALADTAAEAVAGSGPFDEPVDLRALARLYTNSVHVVVPESSAVDRVSDLVGLRVSVGAAGSGTELTATRMLAVAGLGAPSAVQAVRSGVQESAADLAAGRLDAFFWSGGLPTEGITGLMKTTEVRLLPTDELLAGMRSAHGEYVVEQTIPSSVYGTSGDVSTIGVPNLLLVRADLPDDLARALTEGLFDAQAELAEAHPAARTLEERSAITTAPVQLHPGAAEYYRAAKPGVSDGGA